MLALNNRVRADERGLGRLSSHIFRRLFVPAADIIEVARALHIGESVRDVLFLVAFLAHNTRPAERRIPDDVVIDNRRGRFAFRLDFVLNFFRDNIEFLKVPFHHNRFFRRRLADGHRLVVGGFLKDVQLLCEKKPQVLMLGKRRPVKAERVALDDICVVCERQKVDVLAQNRLGLRDHLALRNPQSRFRNRYGEVVDFDSVELIDVDFNELVEAERLFAFVQKRDDFVFKAAERQISFGEKVSATAGGVKEFQRTKFFLESVERGGTLFGGEGVAPPNGG